MLKCVAVTLVLVVAVAILARAAQAAEARAVHGLFVALIRLFLPGETLLDCLLEGVL